jgi:hypothetical protein
MQFPETHDEKNRQNLRAVTAYAAGRLFDGSI